MRHGSASGGHLAQAYSRGFHADSYFERRGDLRTGQPGRAAGSVARASNSSASRASRSPNASSAAREVLSQLVPQPLGRPGPFPDQRLMRPRDHLDRPRLRAVPSRGRS
jgi:hypothetical protein